LFALLLGHAPAQTSDYAFALEQPNAEEQGGILLRFKFTKALRYLSKTTGAQSLDTDEIRYMPTHNSDIFIRKTSRLTEELDPRGRVLKVTSVASTTNRTVQTSEDTAMFPETTVKTGDTWEQRRTVASTQNTNETRKWKLAGFATVRSHRCAVLEYDFQMSHQYESATATSSTERTGKTVVYFDYHLGGLVQQQTSQTINTKTFLTKSRREYNHKNQTQNIITLVE
jgi:hypothetical protein